MSRASEKGIGPEAPDLAPVGKILVADDDPDVVLAIAGTLRAEGHEVVTAMTGEEAVRLARDCMPWLLILDVTLPGLSGYEVCRRLRSDWRFADRGIVMLTSEAFSGQRALSLSAGADDFLLKPFDPGELAARVRLTLRRVQEMRSSSPLTGLPGNVYIQRELQRRVVAGNEVALLYLDLDHFKAYNDHYGFLRGDDAIRALAEALRQAVDGRPEAFLGHVGGDDFVILAAPDEVGGIVRDAFSGFEARVAGLYDPDDAARRWIELRERRGRKRRYDLLTVSVGVATNIGRSFEDHRRLVDVATEMKQYAKSQAGNAVAVDRRSGRNLGLLGWGSAQRSTTRAVPYLTSRGPRNSLPRVRSSPLSVTVRGKDRGSAAPRRSRGRRFFLYPAAALLVAALVAGPATVVLAENARPGDILWPVKLRIEGVRLALEQNPEGDVALHLEFASRRIGELQYVLAGGSQPSLVASVTENLAGHTAAAGAILRELVEAGRVDARTLGAQVQMVLRQNTEILQALIATACTGADDLRAPPEAACPGLQRALERSAEVIETIRHLPIGGDQPGVASEEPPGSSDGHGNGAGGPPNGTPRDQGSGGEQPGHGKGNETEPQDHGNVSGDEQPGQGAQPPGNGNGEEQQGNGQNEGAGGDHGTPPTDEPPAPAEPPGGPGQGPPQAAPGLSN